MSKQINALKLALEALKDLQLCTDDYYESSHEASKKGDKAITAIKEALQSNEQVEPVAWKLVPVNPTREIEDAIGRARNLKASEIWENAINAAHPPIPTAQPKEPEQEPVAWEGGEGWESLAWELCADENGEEACNELIWEGGPIPEPWGDRWMKYEEEAKRLIALVQKHTTPPQRKPLTDEELRVIENKINPNMRWRSSDEEGITLYPSEYYELVRAIEAAHGIKENT